MLFSCVFPVFCWAELVSPDRDHLRSRHLQLHGGGPPLPSGSLQEAAGGGAHAGGLQGALAHRGQVTSSKLWSSVGQDGLFFSTQMVAFFVFCFLLFVVFVLEFAPSCKTFILFVWSKIGNLLRITCCLERNSFQSCWARTHSKKAPLVCQGVTVCYQLT